MSDQEQSNESPPAHHDGDEVVSEPSNSEEEVSRQRREGELYELARKQAETSGKLARFTLALVIATICTIGVGVWQACISWKAANAARDAADAATSAAKTANASLRDSNSNAKSARQEALDAFHQEMRAYVSVTGFVQSQAPLYRDTQGLHYAVDVHFTNTGRTPAVNVRDDVFVVYTDVAKSGIAQERVKRFVPPVYSCTAGGGIIPPGKEEWMTGLTVPIDETVGRELVNSKEIVVVYGFLQYQDIFGDPHEIGFCGVKGVGVTPFGYCGVGNRRERSPRRYSCQAKTN